MLERPLFWSAAAFAAGMVFLPSGLPDEIWSGCALAALGGAVCLSAVASTVSSTRLAFLFLLAGFGLAGGLASVGASHREPYDIATLVSNHPILGEYGVEAIGSIAREPVVMTSDVRGAAQVEMLVDLSSIKIARSRIPCEGRVRFRMPAASAAPAAPGAPLATPVEAARLEPPRSMHRGTRVTLFGRIGAAPRYGNEGSFDYARYLSGRGIEAVGTIKSPRLVTLEEPSPLPRGVAMMRRIDRLRGELLRRIDDAFGEGWKARRARAVAAALLLGERWGLDPDDALALQEAGLTHLLAVSGFNVAVLAGILLLTLRGAGCGARAAALAALPILSLYLLLNREESSVVRAVIMASAWLVGRLIWRRPDLRSMLGLSALAILAVTPAQVDDPGFQLTFCATLSLILLASLFSKRRSRGDAGAGLLARLLAMIGAAAAATLAALVGTLPLTITHFNRVTPGALPANLLAGPMMAAAFIAVIALVAVPPACTLLARAAAGVVLWLVNGSFMTADAVRSIPAMAWRRPTPGMTLSLVYYLALIATLCALCRRRPKRRLTVACLVATGSVSLLLIAPLDTRHAPDGLRLTMLDVGQGDSMLIETPSRRRLLVDGGGSARGEFDVGERVVSAALWRAGIAGLDVVAVTHEDADHIGGMAAVVRNFRPKEVWLPAGWEQWSDRPGLRRLRAAARQTGALMRPAKRGDRLRLGEADIEVLNPPGSVETGRPDNERSFVLEARLAGRTMLLAGDAGVLTETELEPLVGRADLLKVGHHGSRSSSTRGFLAALHPRIAAISCGLNNRFGHPHPEVVARLRELGARICRTDEDGAFSIELLGFPVRGTRLSESCALASRRSAIRTLREIADGG